MKNSASDRLAVALATWFGSGYAPAAPGTVGALAAVALAWLIHSSWTWPGWWFAAVAAVLVWPAVWAARRVEILSGRHDPGTIVVDEVLGQWVTLAGAATLSWKSWLAAFVLFRLFDIWKPFPVRQCETLGGGVGVIADDVMAGIYGALVLALMGWCNLY